ncbi:hypothetical protein STAS_19093 [Striga asiatica]|uniref:Uncharacterized protein n=1 Tax=Striga asiatica TaxID=4170 RepID=A0A5A7QD81_STRAF|nr:hypothetical protein STAS_19093 [Striga asiatica]
MAWARVMSGPYRRPAISPKTSETLVSGQAEASKKGAGGNLGTGGEGGGSRVTGGGMAGATGPGPGPGPDDFGQKGMGSAGWASNGSTVYISILNMLNMSLKFLTGPAAGPQPFGP